MPTAHILGLGKSGVAAARLLQSQAWQVIASDQGNNSSLIEQKQELESLGIQVNLQSNPQWQAKSLDLIVVSPGIPWDAPVLEQARALGIKVIGEVELAWQYLKNIPWIAITGTNGKTTTTSLVAAIFAEAGINAPACGNIGIPVSAVALSGHWEWLIAEISSYQIESAPSVCPQIGAWTTFTPDHLDRHHNLENYRNIKQSLIERSQQIVLNQDDQYLAEHGKSLFPAAIWTSCQNLTNGAYLLNDAVYFQGESLFPISRFQLMGNHNRQNLLMAVAIAKLAGIKSESISQAIQKFKGVPHRLEFICDRQGIKFINDSKATNYDAALVGLAAVHNSVILIAGGEAKQGEPRAWLELIKLKAAKVLLIGKAAPHFADLLEKVNYTDYEISETLERAVPRAFILAQDMQIPYVLFSPACASFDQFSNFEQRGDRFRALCQNLGL